MTQKKLFHLQTIFLGLALGFSSAKAWGQAAPDATIWNSRQGKILDTRNCQFKPIKETAYRIVFYTGNNGLPYENMRNHQGQIVHKVPNQSLVLVDDKEAKRDRYEFSYVVGTSSGTASANDQNSDLVNTWKDEESEFSGYIYGESLVSLKGYTIEVMESPKHLAEGLDLKDTMWLPKLDSNGDFLVLSCRNEKATLSSPLMFNVYDPQANVLLGEVAVRPKDFDIFKKINVITDDEGREKFTAAREALLARGQGHSTGATRVFEPGTSFANEVDTGQPSARVVEAGGADSSNAVDLQGEEVSYDTHSPGDEEEIDFGEDVPMSEGALEFITCLDNNVLNVRPFNNTSDVLFRANNYESVIPVQGFGNDTSYEADIGGETYNFIKVEFPGRRNIENEQYGWVAEEFVKETSQCVGYQKSLGDDQPIVCTASGTLNIRDESFEDVLFSAAQFESVAIRSDAEDVARTYRSGNSSYEMIPVNFPDRANETGWVAKEFVKAKKDCEPYKIQGDCCVFPTKYRATHSYRTGMRAFGYNRDGGRRKHAAADIYRTNKEAVRAVTKGTVTKGPYSFYEGTYALEVRHPEFLVRYGEVYPSAFSGVRVGATVRQGQDLVKIKRIGRLNPMLHFEMYSNPGRTGKLTTGGNIYQRRSDIVDPTPDLQEWEQRTFGRSY